jgi:hypothetical protein
VTIATFPASLVPINLPLSIEYPVSSDGKAYCDAATLRSPATSTGGDAATTKICACDTRMSGAPAVIATLLGKHIRIVLSISSLLQWGPHNRASSMLVGELLPSSARCCLDYTNVCV